MKQTLYRCDRCGAHLGEDGVALERNRFCTQQLIHYRFKFFKNWKSDNARPIVYELCEECRDRLEVWINNA